MPLSMSMDYAPPEVPRDLEAPVGGRVSPGLDDALAAAGAVRGTSMLDDVANDLALWIDQTATEVALAFSPAELRSQPRSPRRRSSSSTRTSCSIPTARPIRLGGRQEIARLGAEGFGHVYKAVVSAYPNLKPAPAPEIEVPEEWPTTGPRGPPPGMPMMPPGADRRCGPTAGLAPPPVPMPGGP